MSEAVIIVGAGYGDEGKGLVTDAYASLNRNSAIVVRYNGGAQAGHTVVTPEGKRHVFSHFGSGSFVAVDTLLSKYFVCNPLIYKMEYKELRNILGYNPPPVYYTKSSYVTTPFDMIVNQVLETRRGDKRHGSVGLGFGQTLERAEKGWPLTMFDISCVEYGDRTFLRNKLCQIRDNFVPQVLMPMISKAQDGNIYDSFMNPQLIENFIDDCEFMCDKTIQLDGIGDIRDWYENFIFEGAQGLLLSEDFHCAENPHTTRSLTGIHNAAKLCQELPNLTKTIVNYVQRVYHTRHGAGLFPSERNSSDMPFNIKNETNRTNKYQGNFRLAPLDITIMDKVIDLDRNKYEHLLPNNSSFQTTFTCLDQINMDKDIPYAENGTIYTLPAEEFISLIYNLPNVCSVSYGPTRETICSTINSEDPPF